MCYSVVLVNSVVVIESGVFVTVWYLLQCVMCYSVVLVNSVVVIESVVFVTVWYLLQCGIS